MRIPHIRPEPPGSGYILARFDIALSEECRVFGLRLVEKPGGRKAVYAPNSGGSRVVTFSPSLVLEIASAAQAAIEGLSPHDHPQH